MTALRFSVRQDDDGTWTVLDGSSPANFTFWGGIDDLTEERARLVAALLNGLERKRMARQASFSRQMQTRH